MTRITIAVSKFYILVLAGVVFSLWVGGCGKKESVNAAKPLQQSFQSADAPVQQAISSVTADLKAGKYAEATRALVPIVSGHKLTDDQKQAVAVALQQINKAVDTHPELKTKEMYELRTKLFQAVLSM